jgi:hypothetical protein
LEIIGWSAFSVMRKVIKICEDASIGLLHFDLLLISNFISTHYSCFGCCKINKMTRMLSSDNIFSDLFVTESTQQRFKIIFKRCPLLREFSLEGSIMNVPVAGVLD